MTTFTTKQNCANILNNWTHSGLHHNSANSNVGQTIYFIQRKISPRKLGNRTNRNRISRAGVHDHVQHWQEKHYKYKDNGYFHNLIINSCTHNICVVLQKHWLHACMCSWANERRPNRSFSAFPFSQDEGNEPFMTHERRDCFWETFTLFNVHAACMYLVSWLTSFKCCRNHSEQTRSHDKYFLKVESLWWPRW